MGESVYFGIAQSSGHSTCAVSAKASAVEEEERALRTMAASIDLNPVWAGMVSDPADYRWSGYAEAMAGKARARRGLVRIIGQMAWSRETCAAGGREAKASAHGGGAVRNTRGRVCSPWGEKAFPRGWRRGHRCFTVRSWEGRGRERKREEGTMMRRGVSAKVRVRLTTENERRLRAEVLMRRVGISRGASSWAAGPLLIHGLRGTGRLARAEAGLDASVGQKAWGGRRCGM